MSNFRSAYSGSLRSSIVFDGEEVLTEQNHLKSSDINYIVSQYQRSGISPSLPVSPSQFGDVSNITSLQDAMNSVMSAQAAFSDLPSHIRKRFNNNPLMLLSALEDPSMRSELISLGVLNAPPAPAPTEEVPPSPTPSPEG